MTTKLPEKNFEETRGLKNSWLENFVCKFTK